METEYGKFFLSNYQAVIIVLPPAPAEAPAEAAGAAVTGESRGADAGVRGQAGKLDRVEKILAKTTNDLAKLQAEYDALKASESTAAELSATARASGQRNGVLEAKFAELSAVAAVHAELACEFSRCRQELSQLEEESLAARTRALPAEGVVAAKAHAADVPLHREERPCHSEPERGTCEATSQTDSGGARAGGTSAAARATEVAGVETPQQKNVKLAAGAVDVGAVEQAAASSSQADKYPSLKTPSSRPEGTSVGMGGTGETCAPAGGSASADTGTSATGAVPHCPAPRKVDQTSTQHWGDIDKRVAVSLDEFFNDDKVWQKVSREIRNSKKHLAVAPGPQKSGPATLKTFRVQVPKHYPGVQYRKSKNLNDKAMDFAKSNSAVTGTVESDGEWLRTRDGLFLPMRVGAIQILEPAPGESPATQDTADDPNARVAHVSSNRRTEKAWSDVTNEVTDASKHRAQSSANEVLRASEKVVENDTHADNSQTCTCFSGGSKSGTASSNSEVIVR